VRRVAELGSFGGLANCGEWTMAKRIPEITDHRMHDGSSNFLSLPESKPWTLTRDHISRLNGAVTEDYLTDDVTEVWIDFRYKGYEFTINNQLGEFWFFVNDPACPETVLEVVAEHFAEFLNCS
jgi:hypothetical protein